MEVTKKGMQKGAAPARQAQKQFGLQARLYAESDVHSAGESLERVMEYAAQGQYKVAVDLGTGAGFTAFALAPYSRHVLATDIAPAMVSQVQRLAIERGLDNVEVLLAEAEDLPFVSGSLDAVSCRHAAHHFHDLPRAAREVRRVLKSQAVFILADTVAPESDYEALWMNDIELKRDGTHQRDLKPSQWRRLLEQEGFGITHSSITKVNLEFNDWVRRSATPKGNVESLLHDFLAAPPSVVTAFGIQRDGSGISFQWDALVLRAVRL